MELEDKLNVIESNDYDILNLLKFESFDGNKLINVLTTGRVLIFMTRPELFIKTSNNGNSLTETERAMDERAYENMARHPFLSQFTRKNKLSESDQICAELLSYKPDYSGVAASISDTAFIPIITNKAKGIDLTDNTMEINTYGGTISGFHAVSPINDKRSYVNGSFTLSFTELYDMEILKTMAIWYKYYSDVTDGSLRANPEKIHRDEIDYAASMYVFILGNDLQTIKYWAKYTGVFPTNLPWSALSSDKGSFQTVNPSINFNYSVKEEQTLSILNDFNNTSLKSTNVLERFNNNDVDFNIDRLLKKNFLKTIPETKRNRVPLVFIKEINDGSVKNKYKKLIIKLGKDSIYKTKTTELLSGFNDYNYDGLDNIYDHDPEKEVYR